VAKYPFMTGIDDASEIGDWCRYFICIPVIKTATSFGRRPNVELELTARVKLADV
jgi:hypothetical protein